jgi:hypothetical protein
MDTIFFIFPLNPSKRKQMELKIKMWYAFFLTLEHPYNCEKSYSSAVALAALRSTERSRTWKNKNKINPYNQKI